MARNIRTIGIKGFRVEYVFNNGGKAVSNTAEVASTSERKIKKALAIRHEIKDTDIIILNTIEYATYYRITDIVKAIELLVNEGLAEQVSSADYNEDDSEDDSED